MVRVNVETASAIERLSERIDALEARDRERQPGPGRRSNNLATAFDRLPRRGRHPEFGVVTMGQHLATWVAHDLGHISQVVRVMARQYSQAVGP
jgi:hypothetical protein